MYYMDHSVWFIQQIYAAYIISSDLLIYQRTRINSKIKTCPIWLIGLFEELFIMKCFGATLKTQETLDIIHSHQLQAHCL